MSSEQLDFSEHEYPRSRVGTAVVVVVLALVWGVVFGASCAVSIAFDPNIGDPLALAASNPAALAMFPLGQVAALIPISVVLTTGGALGLALSQLIATVPIFLLAFPFGVFHVLALTGLMWGMRMISKFLKRARVASVNRRVAARSHPL